MLYLRNKGIRFWNRWSSIGRLVNNGPMPNWNRPRRLPKRQPKKGAPKRPSKRNRPGNQTRLGRQLITGLDFEALEMAAGRQTLRLAAHSLEQRLNTATGPCSLITDQWSVGEKS